MPTAKKGAAKAPASSALHLRRAARLALVASEGPIEPPDEDTRSKQISVTIPVHPLSRLEVLAERSAFSRGAMAVELIQIGLEVVLSQMSADARQEVESVADAKLAGFWREAFS